MVSIVSPCNNKECPFYETIDCSSRQSYNNVSCEHYFTEFSERPRIKAHALVDAYFDKKRVLMKDPDSGVKDWVSAINNPEYWSYLQEFCKNTDKYKIVE